MRYILAGLLCALIALIGMKEVYGQTFDELTDNEKQQEAIIQLTDHPSVLVPMVGNTRIIGGEIMLCMMNPNNRSLGNCFRMEDMMKAWKNTTQAKKWIDENEFTVENIENVVPMPDEESI